MRVRIVDAFTDRPFGGNPAGVCVLPEGGWPPDEWLQSVAAELNLSETAFALPPAHGEAPWRLRWFAPRREANLCGHATLAMTHALHEDGRIQRHVRYVTRSGELAATVGPDGIVLDFPAARLAQVAVSDEVAAAVGVPVRAVYDTGALRYLIVEVADENTVRTLRPDLAAIALLPQRAVAVTAASDPGAGYDFVSRYFAPAAGIPEDPVTGSAHTALAPLWSQRTGRASLCGLQASERSGLVRTQLRGERVLLAGAAVTVLDGTLLPHPVVSPDLPREQV